MGLAVATELRLLRSRLGIVSTNKGNVVPYPC